jgi:AcrR family transcriptional regulator
MTVQCGSSKIDAKRPAGRPRSQASRRAILRAAYSLLERKPFAAISTIEIARQAQVSTATIYRWWKTQEALLMEAFLDKTEHEFVLPTHGRPLARLRDYMLEIGRFFTGKHGIVVARLLAAIQDNPVLRQEFAERVFLPRREEAHGFVRQAIAEGQLPAGTNPDLFMELLIGPLLMRLLLRHEKLSARSIRTVYDLAIAGARAARPRF